MKKDELTFPEFLNIFFQRKFLLLGVIVAFTAAGGLCSLLLPKVYRAESLIMLAPESLNGGPTMLQSGLNPLIRLKLGEFLIGLLRSDWVIDRVIDRFGVMELYEGKNRQEVRDDVRYNILHTDEDVRSGLVSVAVLDESPERAADMTNCFVEELQKQIQTLNEQETSPRRIFFEEQAQQAFQVLSEAEKAMARYQEESGLVAIKPQLQELLTSIARLRAQIAAREIELAGIRSYAGWDNPRRKWIQSQLTAMRFELEKLEQLRASQEGTESRKEFSPSMGQVPRQALEYQRRLREVQSARAIYEQILQEYEMSKLREAYQVPMVQVVSPATPPDEEFKPQYAAILVYSALAGLCSGVLCVLGKYYFT